MDEYEISTRTKGHKYSHVVRPLGGGGGGGALP